jgi:hypothetical protein
LLLVDLKASRIDFAPFSLTIIPLHVNWFADGDCSAGWSRGIRVLMGLSELPGGLLEVEACFIDALKGLIEALECLFDSSGPLLEVPGPA